MFFKAKTSGDMNLQGSKATIILTTIFAPLIPTGDIPQLGKHPLSEIIAAITPEEKAMLVTGSGIPGY